MNYQFKCFGLAGSNLVVLVPQCLCSLCLFSSIFPVSLGLSFKKGGCLPCRQLCNELNALRVKVEASKILYWMLVFFEKTKLDNKFRNADYES